MMLIDIYLHCTAYVCVHTSHATHGEVTAQQEDLLASLKAKFD